MGAREPEHDVRAVWDAKAEAWDRHVGADGDANRRFNSDPVLWRMLGEVDGLRVLDAGCGTAYLSVALARRGARVTGVDLSPEMIRVARRNVTAAEVAVELAVDDLQVLATVADGSVDRVVSNYVLMDLPDHEAALRAMARVLAPGGEAVLVFLHPCFDAPGGPHRSPDGVRYHWPRPYIDRWAFTDRWGDFASDFVTFHRPLSDYWRAMIAAGFDVVDLDEPIVPPDHPDLPPDAVARARFTPYSVAFRLRRR